MAIPTISTVTPNVVSSQGWTYVEVVGTNFREPTVIVPPDGPIPVPAPSVSVLIGGEVPREVGVIDATTLYFVTDAHSLGTHDVVVANLDDDGVPIPGEEVTKANAITVSRPSPRALSDLIRVMHAFGDMLKNQVLPRVIMTNPSVDYSTSPSSGRLQEAAVPAITIDGPNLVPNMMYTQHGNEPVSTSDTTYMLRKRGERKDIQMVLTVMSNSKIEALNLVAVLDLFFRNNTSVKVARDPEDASAGYAYYELYADPEGFRNRTNLNLSNIVSYAIPCYILGFEVESLAGFTNDSVLAYGDTADTLELNNTVGIP